MKKLILFVLFALPIVAQDNQTASKEHAVKFNSSLPIISMPWEPKLVIADASGQHAVTIDSKGRITFAPGITPDEGARQFVIAVKNFWPSMCGGEAMKPPEKPADKPADPPKKHL